MQESERGSSPSPSSRPRSRGAAPPNSGEPPSLACTSVKPELFRPGRKNLGGFFLFGKLDAFYSSLGRILRLFLHPWLIGVQSAGATLRDSEQEMNFTKQPRVHLALKRFEFSVHRVRKEGRCLSPSESLMGLDQLITPANSSHSDFQNVCGHQSWSAKQRLLLKTTQ